MRPIYFLFLFLSLSSMGFAQAPGGYYVRQFNTENGLPSNGIKGLSWDEATGFLWIATEAGIVRYNGMDFKIYGRNDDPHISNERILFMVKNNAGKIYTADGSGNLFFVQKNKLRFFEKKTMVSDSGNNFISTSVSDQLYRSGLNFKKLIFSLQFDKTFSIGDTACFLLHNGDFMYYSKTQITPVYILPGREKMTTGFKLGDKIFLVDRGNVFLFNKSTSQLTTANIFENGGKLTDLHHSTFIWENGMNEALLFVKEKVWTITFGAGQLTAKLICDAVPSDALIRYAQYDKKREAIFIGTDSKGVIIIEKKRVASLRTGGARSTTRTSYYSQFELPDGNVVTNEGHVMGHAAVTGKKLPVKGKFNNNILLVGDTLLYYAQADPGTTFTYLHSYNFNTGKTNLYPKISEGYQLLMASAGDQLYLDKDTGIYRLKADSVELVFPYPKDRSPGLHYDMKEIDHGVLVIAACNSLYRFNIDSKKMDTLFNAGNYCVRTVWQLGDHLFFGTYGGGLFVYKNGVVKPLPLDKNKYLLFTHCFVRDDSGFVWISSNRGLFKANIAELINAYEKNSGEVYYYYYGKNDGMEMTELNGGCTPCALQKKDKTISFPTMDGLLWVNPPKAQTILPGGEIYVDEVLVDNKVLDPDSLKLMELPVKTGEIVIRLGISAWTNKENIYLWYRLNDDSLWRPIDIDKGIEIRFNNLPQGDYHVQLKKRNGFGAANYSFKEIEFHITIPWYKRNWFYLLIAVALTGLVWLYINIRTRQLKANQVRLEKLVAEKTKELQEKNEVLEKNDTIKTRLISIISHDIVTPLKFLTAAGKNLIEKRKQMPEALQDETIIEMANTSQDLQLLSTNILNWIKYQNENRRLGRESFNLHELVNQVIGVLKTLAKQKNNELVNEVSDDFMIHEYMEPLKIIIYNLVSNAINFTENGKIFISARPKNGKTMVTVRDEGVGMTTEQIQNVMADQFIISSVNVDNRKGNGLGYLIIKDLLKMMEGTFQIESHKTQPEDSNNRGTSVMIIIPVKNQH
jgi:signal transduction histidine kinase